MELCFCGHDRDSHATRFVGDDFEVLETNCRVPGCHCAAFFHDTDGCCEDDTDLYDGPPRDFGDL